MLDLALQEAGKPVTLAGISERQSISLSYLEQLFSRLRRNGLVKSVRGPGGGYRLARESHEISVSQIISAVDELIDATQCGGQENCRDERRCMTHDLWASLNTKILNYLSGVSLADLVASQGDSKEDGQEVVFASRECPKSGAKSDTQKPECSQEQLVNA
jgi:Rrf2 family iron-sulfur cluster assembly transcriptional regulator